MLSLSPAEPLTAAQRDIAQKAVYHLRHARDHGLLAFPLLDYRLAWMHLLLGQGTAFHQRAQATLAADPGNAVMLLLVGRQKASEGLYTEALNAYAASIQANPKTLSAHLGLGTLLAQLGDLDRGKEVFKQAGDEIPGMSEIYFNSGLIAALQGVPAEAIVFFERALDVNADYLPARENLAGVLASTGRFRESIDHYRRAIEQSPSDPETRFLAARVYAELGDWDRAEGQLQEALRLNSGFQAAQDLLRLVPER